MKKFSLRIMAALLMAAFMLTGCGVGKMVKKYDTVDYSVTPSPLETHGGKINVTFKGTIPEKYFHPKATVELTPVLTYDGGETAFETIYLKGEDVTEGPGTTIPKTGGSFTQEDEIDYDPAMNDSKLMLKAVVKYKEETTSLGSEGGTQLAKGVVYTSTRVCKDEELQTAEHGYVKESTVSEKANIFFAYNKSNIDWKLDLNNDKRFKKKIEDLENFIAQGWDVKSYNIDAWASPEGEESLNENLSKERGANAENWLLGKLKNSYKDNGKEFVKDDVSATVTAKGEDWEGFQSAMEASDIDDKEAILNVIRSQPSKAEREREIRNMTVVYSEVEDILKPLRRSEIALTLYEPKRTEEEIAKLSTSDPDTLTNKELLYAAHMTDDKAQKKEIYNNTIKTYPQNWVAYNNLAVIQLEEDDMEAAATNLEKANSISPNNGIILNNLGVVASWKGDYESAMNNYEAAQSAGVNTNYNQGIIKIREGDYSAAISKFSGKDCKYNIGLAQLLNGDPGTAMQTLDCSPEKGSTFYLKAIAAARQDNATAVYENLKKAIAKDSKYRDQAKTDLEFRKLHGTGDFESAIK